MTVPDAPPRRSRDIPNWSSYILAAVLTAAAFLVRASTGDEHPMLILLVLPVAWSALQGGLGPGLFATLLVSVGTAWTTSPYGRLLIGNAVDAFAWFLLIASGVAISVTSERLHQSRREALGRFAALSETERQFRQAVADAPFPMMIHDEDGQVFTANHAWTGLSGYSPEALRTVTDWTRLAFGERTVDALSASGGSFTDDGPREEGEYVVHTAAGGRRTWRFHSTDFGRTDAGKRLRLTMATDVTTRRRLEQDLRESEARLRLALASTHQGLYDLDVRTGDAFVTPEYASMLGYDPETFVETNDEWIERLHPEERQKVAEAYRQYLAGETPEYRVEFRQRTADGRWKWILSLGSIVERDAEGAPVRMLGTHTDITAQREADEALRESERRYRELFESNPHPMWVYDIETLAFLAVNDAAIRKYGYSRVEFAGMTLKDIRPPEETEPLLKNIEHASGTLQSSGPWCHRARDGSEMLVEITSHAVAWNDRRARLVMAHDVTARVTAEREARQLSRAVEHSPAPVIIANRAGDIEYVNPAFTRVTGYSAGEATGQNPRFLQSGLTPPEEYRRLWTTLMSGGTWRGKFQNRRKTGETYWEMASVSPIVDGNGEITHFVAVKEDITAQRHAEQMLQQAQRMDAIGRLAGGVAHDFNNMLNVILGYTDMVMGRLAATDPLRPDLEEIAAAARRSAELTGQLLTFARRQTIAPKALDLNAVIGDRVKMLRRLVGEDVAFTIVPGADLWSVWIDPSQIDQILTNLAVNSRDAIAGTGQITVETRNISLGQDALAGRTDVAAGDYVQLLFSDTGCGMDMETASRAFEPFFTTKEPGRGTGLGLSTVYGIVSQNAGTIDIASQPGRGTTFTLSLPRHTALAHDAPVRVESSAVRGDETVLVVEDEPQILRLCQRALADAGYTVLGAGNPTAALVLAAEHTAPIHLLLTDVVMPGMNGKELEERIRETIPSIRTLFMSGYPADVVAKRGMLEPGIQLLQKPFSPRELTRRVRGALDAPAS